MSATAPLARASDTRTLAWLEARLAVNRLRALTRQPVRLIAWLLFVAYVIWLFQPAGHRRLARTGGVTPEALHLAALAVPGAVLLLIGVAVASAAVRAPAAFASRAEARFLVSSGLRPRLVVGWLQLRMFALGALRALVPLTLALSLTPSTVRADQWTMVRLLTGAICVGISVLALRLPVYVAQRRAPVLHLGAAGFALGALGTAALAAAVAADTGVALPGWVATAAAALPPGSWLVDAIQGGLVSLLGLLALAALCVRVALWVGDDCFPELWTASVRRFDLRRSRRAGFGARPAALPGAARGAVQSRSGRRVPNGAAAIIWKEIVTTLRGQTRLGTSVRIAAAFGAGGTLGWIDRAGPPGLAGTLATLGISQFALFTMVGSVRVADDLRSPVWWMSVSSARDRLLAWSFGSSLRQAVPLGLGLATWFAITAEVGAAFGALPAAMLLCWLMRCIALVLFTVFPTRADLRGPVALIRIVLFAVLALPMLAAGLLGFGLASPPVVIAGMVSLVGVIEGILLVSAATARIERDPMQLARAEVR